MPEVILVDDWVKEREGVIGKFGLKAGPWGAYVVPATTPAQTPAETTKHTLTIELLSLFSCVRTAQS